MTRDRYLNFGGIPVRFRVRRPLGQPKNRVLMIPSPLLRAELFEPLAARLSENGCLCVYCDLPGFGVTAANAQKFTDPQTAARMLWGVLDTLDSEEGGRLSCWHIISHGLAAQTCWDMVRLSPDSVATIVHLCPAFAAPSILQKPTWYALLCRLASGRIAFSGMARLFFGRSMPSKETEPLRRAFLRPGVQENLGSMLTRKPPQAPLFSFSPKLVLWSGQDGILGGKIPPEVTAALPDAEYHTMRTSGHVPMVTHPRAVSDFLRGWMTENGS